MSKLLTVVGATGTQGLSLINAALKDGSYKIRGLTRNPNSEKAAALSKRGVEVVKADINDGASLVEAFKGSNAIFATTDFFEPFNNHGPEKAIEIEAAQGINLARAAAQTSTLEHYIWSTLPNGGKLTGGKYLIPHFVAKNRIDDYIKADEVLYPKTSFLWIAWYGNNFQYPVFTPSLMKLPGKYVQLSPVAADVPIRAIGNPIINIGIFALAVLKKPEVTLPGRFVLAANEDTTTGKLLEDWSEVTGHAAQYVQSSTLQAYADIFPAGWGHEMGEMMVMWEELREKSWSGEEPLVTIDELGLRGNAELTTVKDAYKAMEWSTLL